MGRKNIIWKNTLENYVMDLYFNKRKTHEEIAEIVKNKKKINISREAVRNFINKEIQHNKTQENTVKQA